MEACILSNCILRRTVTEVLAFFWACTAHGSTLWRLELRLSEWKSTTMVSWSPQKKRKSLHFSLHSNYSCLHVRVADIVLCPSPQLHQSSIVLQKSTQICSSGNPPCWAEDFPSWWVHIVYMEITFHLSQKFRLFSVEFRLSFRTLLYQFSDFISHFKSVFQWWNIFYCIPDGKIKCVAVAVRQQTFFNRFLDLSSNPIFSSCHGWTSIIALPTSILNFEIYTQQRIFDANDNCISICLSDWHQTNIFLAHCYLLVYPMYANYKLFLLASVLSSAMTL